MIITCLYQNPTSSLSKPAGTRSPSLPLRFASLKLPLRFLLRKAMLGVWTSVSLRPHNRPSSLCTHPSAPFRCPMVFTTILLLSYKHRHIAPIVCDATERPLKFAWCALPPPGSCFWAGTANIIGGGWATIDSVSCFWAGTANIIGGGWPTYLIALFFFWHLLTLFFVNIFLTHLVVYCLL